MILLTNKHRIEFQIDEEDYESVSRYSWHLLGRGYLVTKVRRYQKGIWIGQMILRLPTFLLGKAPEGLEWDHHNQDKLDNRRFNLRLVTPVVNSRNRGAKITNSTGHRGIYKTRSGRFGAGIQAFGKPISLGVYDTLEEAIAARKAGEKKYWGDER